MAYVDQSDTMISSSISKQPQVIARLKFPMKVSNWTKILITVRIQNIIGNSQGDGDDKEEI